MTLPGNRTEPGRWNASRILLIAGVACAVLTLVSWFAFDKSPKTNPTSAPPGTCQVPTGGKAGAEPPPPLVDSLLAPFGAADVTFTKSAGGSTVYGHCFNVVQGKKVNDAIDLLSGHGYTFAPGEDAEHQLNFTDQAGHPYGISLTVTGDLTVRQPSSTALGGVSIVWQDEPPPSG